MKKTFSILVFVFLLNHLCAQEKESIEIGATLLTLNLFASRHFQTDKPRVEYPNGLFLRYSRNRLALRALASYSEYTFSNVDLSFNTRRTGLICKDLRLGFGVQQSFAKKAKWLYTFTDVLYRHVSSSGFSVTENPNLISTYNMESDGIDAFLGLGSSCKIHERFYLVQEVGLNVRYERIILSNPNTTITPYSYRTTYLRPMFRVSLLFKLPKTAF